MFWMSTSGLRFRVDRYVISDIRALTAWMAFLDGIV